MISSTAALRTAARKYRTLAGFDRHQLLWIFPLFFLSGLFRLAVLTLPFRWISPLLGRQNKSTPLSLLATLEQEDYARRTGRVVKAVCKYTPWESKCLIQALLAALMLRVGGVPYVAFLGLARSAEEESGYAAHAWLSTGRCAVTGGRGYRHYGVVAVYVYESGCTDQTTKKLSIKQVDMILIGGHGKGLTKLLMGHVTEKVIGKAHCAVLVIEKQKDEVYIRESGE